MATVNAVGNTLQSPFTLGSTSVTSTGTQINYLAGLTAVPINKINTQVFTVGSGTYTPTAGMVYCIIECVGPGGGGGGAADSTGTASGGGGGGGAYSRKFATAATVGASQSYLVGAGGAGGAAGNNNGSNGSAVTFLGAICTAGVGIGAFGAAANSPAGAGGGGAAGTGDFSSPGCGGGGGPGGVLNSTNLDQGRGGAGPFGGQPQGQIVGLASGGVAGANGGNYGAGGNGGGSSNSGGAHAGGNGADGVIIITEFISA